MFSLKSDPFWPNRATVPELAARRSPLGPRPNARLNGICRRHQPWRIFWICLNTGNPETKPNTRLGRRRSWVAGRLSHDRKLKFGSMFSQHVAQFTLSRFPYLSISICYVVLAGNGNGKGSWDGDGDGAGDATLMEVSVRLNVFTFQISILWWMVVTRGPPEIKFLREPRL